jgi:undecaprenyl-diphosphatase
VAGLDPRCVCRALLSVDEHATRYLNATVRQSPAVRGVVAVLADRLAVLEVALMVLLGLAGRRSASLRMLTTVGAIYVALEVLGVLFPRQRPFARLEGVEPLVRHTPERSFPSRHVASGLAMAVIGGGAHPSLGRAMATVAGLLGATRVAAGLHYPSDVLAGAVLGLVGGVCGQRLFTQRD